MLCLGVILLSGPCLCGAQIKDRGHEPSEDQQCSLSTDNELGTSFIMTLHPKRFHHKQTPDEPVTHAPLPEALPHTTRAPFLDVPKNSPPTLPPVAIMQGAKRYQKKPGGGGGGGGKGGHESEEESGVDGHKEAVTLSPTVVPGAEPAIDIAPGMHTYKDRWKLCIVLLIMAYSTYRAGKLIFELFGAWQAVKTKRGAEADSPTSRGEELSIFLEYLKYRFDYWIAWTNGAKPILILLISLLIMMFGAKAYCHFVGERFTTSIWKCFVWLVAPDGGIEEETLAGCFMGALMSICGLIIFAILLTVLQDLFLGYLERLSEGESPVMETGHIVIIGMTEDMIPVIQELCMAYESFGGCVIAVSTNICSKPEMEEKINSSNIDLMNSQVVVRCGHPHRASSLKHVAADTAKLIIVMPDFRKTKELRDASVLHTLITLHGEGWPIGGRIIAVCSLVRNRPIFDQMGGSRTQVVMLDKFLAKLMVQCSRHVGICTIFTKTFGFAGSEFYIQRVSHHLVGKTFYEASFHFPQAVLVGVQQASSREHHHRQESKVNFCPHKDYVLSQKEELILLAEDTHGAIPTKLPYQPMCEDARSMHLCRQEIARQESKAETIMIFGWNKLLGQILLELEGQCAPGSTVIVLSAEDPEMRKNYVDKVQERDGARLVNIANILQVEGQLGSRYLLEQLPIPLINASRIFILAADDETGQHPDACTLTMVLQIQDILRKNGRSPGSIPIIPEIRDSTLDSKQCSTVQITDFINLNGLPSQVLAMIAYQPRILHVLEEIISEEATVHFAMRHLQDYIAPGTPLPSRISFLQARDMGHSFGDMVIGWSEHWDKKSQHRSPGEVDPKVVEWTINPLDKLAEREFSHLDRLVVMTKSP